MSLQARLDIEALNRLLAPYDRTDMPGFAVGVSVRGQAPYRRGVGLASAELSTPLSPSIRMRIGSTTKHFCALAVLLLQEDGRLSIDASPRAILPELPGWADAITIRQLMAHTSGMRDSLDLLMMSGALGRPVEADAQFRMLSALDSVNFAPGSSWNYNNGGYVLLSLIIERLSELPLAEFLRRRIFEPIGMWDTLLRPLDTDLISNSATLHVPTSEGGWIRGVMGAPVGGEGGVVSTVDDMLRWLAHMDTPLVGSARSWAEMRTPEASHGYGLGLIMDKHRGLDAVHHAGGVIGGACQMIKLPDVGLDIILMTNGRNALELYRLADAIIDACLPDLPPPPQIDAPPAFSGVFHGRESGRVISLAEHEGQQLLALGGMMLPTRWGEDGTLRVEIAPTDLVVRPRSRRGEVVALDVVEFGVPEHLERVTPPAEADARALTGVYEAPGAGLTAQIALHEGGPVLTVTGRTCDLTYALRPLGPSLWEAVAAATLPVWMTLEFDADGFRATTGRTVRLAFKRRP